MNFEYPVQAGDFTNAGSASSSVKKTLKQLNVDPSIIKRVVVALYEAEVNVVAHSHGGTIYVVIDNDKIAIKLEDKGPGIPDIDLAMTVGYSTASPQVREMGFGAGMGLPNIKHNVDYLDVKSEVNVGTIVEMIVNF
ncbi:MAG: ATP-binding protein [Bacteroidales bacterium]|nr:ATP-binding protein [Bacteroidales bacterium]